MEASEQCSTSTKDLPTPSNTIHGPNQSDRFHVHFLAVEKLLENKHYESLGELRRDAFHLYEKAELHDNNAILSYVNSNQEEVLLTTLPDPFNNSDEYRRLFIHHVSSTHLDESLPKRHAVSF